MDEARNGANYTLLNLNHPVTGTAWLKIARYVYAAEKYDTRVAIANYLSYRESLTFFLAFSSSVVSSRVFFFYRFRILQILQDERSTGMFLIRSLHPADFLTRLFVYLSRINNFLLVNHHDVPLETQFSSLSPTVNLLEGALDNLFLSLFLSLNNLSSGRREEKNSYDDDDNNEEEGREDEETRARHSQPIRVDVKADRRSQRRIYNQHDCLTPHNQRPYPYHASGIVASPFVLLRPRPHLSPPLPDAGQVGHSSLRSFHVDTIRDPLLSSPLFSSLASFLSSHHLFGYLLSVRCHCARGLITPITTRNETRRGKVDERNGHGYIIGDRNNARASLFSSPGDLPIDVAFSLSVKTFVRE